MLVWKGGSKVDIACGRLPAEHLKQKSAVNHHCLSETQETYIKAQPNWPRNTSSEPRLLKAGYEFVGSV